MKRLLCSLLLAGLATGCAAHGLGSLAEIAVVDRDTGAELSLHPYRGEYWVAGRPGARYAIEIRNTLGERLLAVTSVDGVNVVSGATAGWNQTGYVLAPGQRCRITGWRKSDAEVAAFTFTPSEDSYAERTGRPANVGVIGVALFRERQDAIPSLPYAAAPLHEPADAAPLAGLPAASLRLGTGHGERETSYAGHTEFLREHAQPEEIIRIRYDSLERLVALGILPRPRRLPPVMNPFPASPVQEYVPDPPG